MTQENQKLDQNFVSEYENFSIEEPDHKEVPSQPTHRLWLIFACLTSLSFLISLESAILVPVLPSIAVALHGSTTDTLWGGSSYLLTVAIFQPLIGALSEDFGRGRLLFFSIATFTIGCFICAVADDISPFLIGRSIQGIGGGGIMALLNIIPTDIIPLRQRPFYMMLTQTGWAAGVILGPLVGGFIGQHTTWRWVFYINFPVCGITLLVVPFVVKLKGSQLPMKERIRNLDYVGAFLFLGSMCSLLLGLTWGGVQFAWDSWQTVLPIVSGAVGLVAALVWEGKWAFKPFLHLSLFNDRSGNAVYVCTFLQGLLMFCELYYLPLYFEGVRGYSSASTGITLIPVTSTMILGAVVTGSLIHKTGHFRWAIWLGFLVTTVSTGLLLLFDTRTPTYTWVLIFLCVGLGHGLLTMSLNYGIQALAEKEKVGHAANMDTFLRAVGMCIGIALGSTVLQNALKGHLRDAGLPESSAKYVLVDIMSLSKHPGLKEALSLSFNSVSEVMIAVAAGGLVISAFVGREEKKERRGYVEMDE